MGVGNQLASKRSPTDLHLPGIPAKDHLGCQTCKKQDDGGDAKEENANHLIEGCGSPLWQMNGQLRRYEPARFIKRHLHNFFKYLILSPFFAAYGAYVSLRAALGLLRGGNSARLALRNELRCQHGHANPVIGRWRCASCSAHFHGWVGRCPICGAGAAWFPCSTCGVGIRLPWEHRG